MNLNIYHVIYNDQPKNHIKPFAFISWLMKESYMISTSNLMWNNHFLPKISSLLNNQTTPSKKAFPTTYIKNQHRQGGNRSKNVYHLKNLKWYIFRTAQKFKKLWNCSLVPKKDLTRTSLCRKISLIGQPIDQDICY